MTARPTFPVATSTEELEGENTHMRKMRTAIASIAALSLVLAACGGDDGDSTASGGDTAVSESADTAADTAASESADTAASESADTAASESVEPASDTVDVTQGADLTFHMITHSDSGPFWSVVKRGMEAAGEDLGVTVVWLESVNDPGVQVQLIEQAIAEGSDGIAASLPSPDQ